KKEREKWGHMMEEYFETREQLSVVVLIVDMRHKPTADDINMYHYVKHIDLPVIIIATKADKLKKQQRQKNIKEIKEALEVDADDPVIPFSSETGEGKDLAWRHVRNYI